MTAPLPSPSPSSTPSSGASASPAPGPFAPASWRSLVSAVIPDATGARFLVTGDAQSALPRIVIPDHHWAAECDAVVDGFQDSLGFRPWVLRPLRFVEDEAQRTVHMTVALDAPPASWSRSKGLTWASLDTPPPLDDAAERTLVATLRAERAHGAPASRQPWAHAGGAWRDRALAWIDRTLATAGRLRTGEPLQQRTWGISSVLRVPTDAGRVFFKSAARLPLFVNEGAFVRWLADAAPEHSVDVVGHHPDEGWLLSADFGATMRPTDKGETIDTTLREAMGAYGALQRRLAPRMAEARAVGAKPRDLAWLANEIAPLLRDPFVQATVDADVLTNVASLAPRLTNCCAELAACALPDSLVHGDLHPGNLAVRDGRTLFFDWTDAAIGHPFLDPYVSTSRHFPARTAAIAEGYLAAWEGAADRATLERAWLLARPLTMLYQACSYRHLLTGLEPQARDGLNGGLSGWLAALVAEDAWEGV